MESNEIFDKSLNKKVIDSQNFDIVLTETNESIVEYFGTAISLRLEIKLFDLFDNYLINCLKSDINVETNVLFGRILSLCSQFNDLCSQSDNKSIVVTKDDIITNVLKVCNNFGNSEFESGLKYLILLRNSYKIGNKSLTLVYDSCVKTLIKNCVKTVFGSVVLEDNDSSKQIDLNEWVVAKSSARIDLQGGWTDTPPICYELGGRVINIAIGVNQKKPIGAKARKVNVSQHSIISIKEYDFNRRLITHLILNDINQLSDYNEPDSCGALVKSALICCQIIDLKNQKLNLCQQLRTSLNSGLEIELWSNLPQGSGLGTSSILSGCVIAVLWVLLGKKFSKTSLINAVLYMEQLMSTGGGWQDQVGGIVGGVKLGRSLDSLPLRITFEQIKISPSFRKQFEKHLVLIYSGSVRLAKNLLQNVIKNWYIRDKQITQSFNQLLTNTDIIFKALLNEDLETIGTLLSNYWEIKKILAPNSEPKHVSQFLKRVEPLIYGGSLCGAGGGGFMALIAKNLDYKNQIIPLIEEYLPESQVYDCFIDEKGFELSVNGVEWDVPH